MIVFLGYLSLDSLSVREYPEVHFSQVQVFTHYPSASPDMVENAVTNPLEDRLAGIEGIETIISNSKYASSDIQLTFKNGISLDKSLLAIREAIGLARLPYEVQPPVVTRKTVSEGMPFMVMALKAPSMDFAALTHYANLNLKNAFRGIKGVASAEVWGQPYTYDITLDARKMYAFGINTEDVFEALKRSNLSLAAGKFQNEISVTLNSELKTIEDYENLIIKQTSHPIVLKQISDIQLKSDNKRFRVRINGEAGLCIAIQKSNDANPLEVSTLVNQQLEQVISSLAEGLELGVILDQADFVRQSLKNVKFSIIEAMAFVLIIVFLFLRNLKATIIPLIAIPISLMGSFLFLKMFGFSINIMTLLAMILAIGLVVDDAMVILENIQRHIEEGLSPLAASIKGSKEIGFAIVAMTLTLTSVYAPLAFISGVNGQLFIEFAVALSGSVLISGLVALSLSPLMCERILRHNAKPLWPQVDCFLERVIQSYQKLLKSFLFQKKISCLLLFISFLSIAFLVKTLPTETAPKEDRNLIGVYIPPIPGKNLDAMEQSVSLVEHEVQSISESAHRLVFMGEWGANVVLPLKPQHLRKHSAQEIIDTVRPALATIPSLDVHPWSEDSGLPGIENGTENDTLSLVLSTTENYTQLFKVAEKIRKQVEAQKRFDKISHNLKLDTPGYEINLDTNQMARLNISSAQIAKTIEVFFSGDQSLEFSKDGILYAITLQGKSMPWSLNELYLTNNSGKKISIGAIANMIQNSGPEKLFHYNQMRSVILSTDIPKNNTFGQAMTDFNQQVGEALPAHYKKTWTGSAKTFSESNRSMVMLFCLAIIFIYAILAIQFENFIDPLIILLTVPLACFGGLFFIWLYGGSLNIYTQIGLITLIGLITKHGILIVEFTNVLWRQMSLKEAIVQAASLRLRPILMTTGAMVFGAMPLILSTDSGHEARQAIGIVLVGGLTLGTLFTLFILPTVCYMMKNIFNKSRP